MNACLVATIVNALPETASHNFRLTEHFSAYVPPHYHNKTHGYYIKQSLSVPTEWIPFIQSILVGGFLEVTLTAPCIHGSYQLHYMVSTGKDCSLDGPMAKMYRAINFPDWYTAQDVVDTITGLPGAVGPYRAKHAPSRMDNIDLMGTFLVEGPVTSNLPEELQMSGIRQLVRLEVSETRGQLPYNKMILHTIPAFRTDNRTARVGNAPFRGALPQALDAEATATAAAKAIADAGAAGNTGMDGYCEGSVNTAEAIAKHVAHAEATAIAEAEAKAGAETLAVAAAEEKATAEAVEHAKHQTEAHNLARLQVTEGHAQRHNKKADADAATDDYANGGNEEDGRADDAEPKGGDDPTTTTDHLQGTATMEMGENRLKRPVSPSTTHNSRLPVGIPH